MLLDVLRFRFRAGWTMDWGAVVIAVLEAGLFWGLAAVVFSYRDIACRWNEDICHRDSENFEPEELRDAHHVGSAHFSVVTHLCSIASR